MYVLSNDLPDRASHLYEKKWKEAWKLYKHYLQSIQNKLRPSTREFALAEWHYNNEDHRCPHDSWLQYVQIQESASEGNIQERAQGIIVRLLGAYHNAHIELIYQNVLSYCLDQPYRDQRNSPNQGHGDWLVDEIRFSDRGKVIHEIEWGNSGNWVIECDDIEYRWLPEQHLGS